MPDTLVDSSVIIDALREVPDALNFIDDLGGEKCAVTHALVIAEVIEGALDARDLFKIQRFFRRFRVIHPNEDDSIMALKILPSLHLSHNVGTVDCLIAATALRFNLPVATTNDRHFRLFKGLTVIRPY